MKIILLGPPAAGKGTQAEVLAERFSIPPISTGAIIRKEISEQTVLGKKASALIDDGQLVPDEIVIQMVKERIAQPDCANGYILDGFPRTVVQAQAVDQMGITFDKVILFDVSDDEVIRRITGRRECESCGRIYHTVYHPPKVQGVCDQCAGKLLTRDDDTEETVRKRLSVYHDLTEPLKSFYAEKKILVTVKGREKIEDTTADMLKALGV